MAAPLTIEKLPTDISAAISKFLGVEDIKKLRQTCRWAEKETFKEFASRGYRKIRLRVTKAFFDSLTKVLESERLAASVQCVHVAFKEYHWTSEVDVVSVQRVMARLHNLSTVTLAGLSSTSLATQFPRNDWPALAHLTRHQRLTLELEYSRFTGEELQCLLSAFKGIINRVRLLEIVLTDLQWRSIFGVIRSLELDGLDINRLSTSKRTCHKHEKDTYSDVARRGGYCITLFVSKQSLESFTRVLQDSPQLASAVSELLIGFPACNQFAGQQWRTRLAKHGTAMDDIPSSEIGQLIARLPELAKPQLKGINSSVLSR
ncbi:hypothetical protein LTR85_010004 [Meristemomyces frigidus]|nr:hypothetical protein LTR85_010004 [Meristemomyces frigidus]